MFSIAIEQEKLNYHPDKQLYNLQDDDEEESSISMHLFQCKFMKELNFQQNYQKRRQRRIKKINEICELKKNIFDMIKIQQVNQTSRKMPPSINDNIKEIQYKGSLIKGKIKKRVLHGETQILYENGTTFQGVFKHGKMKTGKFVFKNGYQYWGELQGKHFMGKGTLKTPDGIRITGLWSKDEIIGRAEIQYSTGDTYYGEIQNFRKHGEGYFFFNSGNKFLGHFQHGCISGKGAYFLNDGSIWKGTWRNGQLIDQASNESDQDKQSFLSNANSEIESTLIEKSAIRNSEVENFFIDNVTVETSALETSALETSALETSTMEEHGPQALKNLSFLFPLSSKNQ